MSDPACETCRHWNEFARGLAGGAVVALGECRRRAPALDREGRARGAWPATRHDDWCGEHAPRIGPP